MLLIGADYPFMDVLWSMIIFFCWVAWIWLLILVFSDLFRRDISGWAKAAWCVFLIILPFLGVLIYLIANGSGMAKRDMAQAQAAQQQFDSYVRQTAGSASSSADELAKLAGLRDQGVITDAEFAAQKAKLLA